VVGDPTQAPIAKDEMSDSGDKVPEINDGDAPSGTSEPKNEETQGKPETLPRDEKPMPPKGPAVQQSPRFSELTFLTSHNSFVNNQDSFWAAPNQSRSLQYQLENGVTALMLDIHGEKAIEEASAKVDPSKRTSAAVLCHEHCGKPDQPLRGTRIPGLFQKMDFVKYLETIRDYVNKNPNAILTVFLEDYVNVNQLKEAFDKAPGFQDRIFDPWKYQVKEKGWPRIDQLIRDNKRILVISDHGGKESLGVVFGPDFTNENYWSMGTPLDSAETLKTECKTRWDNAPLNRVDPKFAYLFVMNNFRDIPVLGPVRDDNNINFLRTRINTKCASVAEKKPNYLAVDHFDEADWGARKMVAELNDIAVLLFKNAGFQGTLQMLKPGRYLTRDLSFGDNQLTSLRVYARTRVKLYEDDNFQKLLVELTEDSRDLGAAAKKVSSIEIIHE